METAQDRHHDMGEVFGSHRTSRNACYTVSTDPRRLKSCSDGEKTVISTNAFSVKYSSC